MMMASQHRPLLRQPSGRAPAAGRAAPVAAAPHARRSSPTAHPVTAQDPLAARLARVVRKREGAVLARKPAPRITAVTIDLSPPQDATLTWNGTPPEGDDHFTVSTGKGYSDVGDDPGTCTRTCCDGADVQCAPPWDEPRRLGACCTPVGTFHTGRTRPEQNGWLYWTPVEPLHTAYGRGIAMHQHSEVTGQAIGHGCIRMDEPNAKRIADHHTPGVTKVVIKGRAKVACAATRQCKTTGMLDEPAPDVEVANVDETGGDGPGGQDSDWWDSWNPWA
jgi:L,D-transpeptidase catalytic domain